MDAQGIDMAVLSINPNWYDADRDLATQVVTVQNEGIAAVLRVTCAIASRRSHRWHCSSPISRPRQLERAMKTMGFRGAAIGGNVAGRELSDAAFHPFWAKAEELGAVVFIHPQASGDRRSFTQG